MIPPRAWIALTEALTENLSNPSDRTQTSLEIAERRANWPYAASEEQAMEWCRLCARHLKSARGRD